MQIFNPRAYDVFKPTDGSGNARGASMSEAQAWGIGIEQAILARTSIDTLAELTSLEKANLVDGEKVAVLDGETGGIFTWDEDSTATATAGMVIATDEGGDGRWVRDYVYGDVSVLWTGAVADRVDRTDGVATSGDATFTSAGASFTSADEGKLIYLIGAGAAGAGLATTIASVNSATSIELTDAPSTDVDPCYFTYGTDSAAAINAAIGATPNSANSSIGSITRLPPGGFLVSEPIVLDDEHGAWFQGSGKDATSIRAAGDFEVISMQGASDDVLNKVAVSDMTIIGGHRSYTSAYGIKATWTNHCRASNLIFKGCRAGIYTKHGWQFEWCNVVATGGSDGDKNFDGFYMDSTTLSFVDNAVVGDHVYSQYVENDGIRIINGQGSKFSNCEMGGCGRHGWYIGDPPSGTVLCQWMHFTNCLADSVGGVGWNIIRGSATELSEMQFSNCWSGNTASYLIEVRNADNLMFENTFTINCDTFGILLNGSNKILMSNTTVLDVNTGGGGSGWAVLLQDSSNCRLITGTATKAGGTSPSIAEGGTSNNNRIAFWDVDNGMSIIGSGTRVLDCIGYVTDNKGSFSATPDGNGNITVAHGLSGTPTFASAQISGDTVNHVDVQSVDGTNLTLRIKDSSGADVTAGTITGYWRASL